MDIQGILHRFADNTVTEAERAEFAAYLKGLSPEAYEVLMEQYEAIEKGAVAYGVAAPVLLTRILEEIDVLERLEWRHEHVLPNDDTPWRRRSLMRWPVLAAAACVLLIVGIYILRRPMRPAVVTPGAAAVVIPIAPGGNKAILTLGNGSSIVLDSLANGRLTGEGSADVIKLADGKLQYRRGVGDNATGKVGGNTTGTGSDKAGMLYNTLTTPRGGQYQVVLSDGTKVWLNAASAIRYPTTFTGGSREVEVRGEVYFEVARDNIRPFNIRILPGGSNLPAEGDRMSIQVLGTSFNVNAYEDEAERQVRTTLLEGAVRVSLGSVAQVIRPGQQAGIAFGDRSFSIRKEVDMESVMAWKNGKLVFNKGDVRELMLEISRWYDVDVRYQGQVPSGGFYGLIDRNVPLASVLHVLGAYGIKTKLENKTIIVQ